MEELIPLSLSNRNHSTLLRRPKVDRHVREFDADGDASTRNLNHFFGGTETRIEAFLFRRDNVAHPNND